MSLESVKQIVTDIRQGNVAPIYFLTGEESYYIDKISAFIESEVLDEADKGFNQMVLYGRDVSIEDVVSHAKRFPMMAERQVIVVKEAQDLARSIEKLLPYVEQPQPTTVLVLCYKYKKLDGRSKLAKALKSKAVFLESKKLYDNQVPDWIRRVLAGKGFTITPKAAQMLTDFLGNDLNKVNNELEKLQLIMDPGGQVTPELIEENIGISKDFNSFELQRAIGTRNTVKAYGIARHFAQNPKNHPFVLTTTMLYAYFARILKYHSLMDKKRAPEVLGVSPYFVKEYQEAARNYPMKKVSKIVSYIREVDMKNKGVGANRVPEGDLLKELLVEIFD